MSLTSDGSQLDESPSRDRLGLRAGAVLAALALVPCALAVCQLGRVQPDEVFQALEPAYWRTHGYGMMSWEWGVGLRNWAVPGVFAGILWICQKLGIDHPIAYRAAVEVPVYFLHLAMLVAVYRDARRRGANEVASALAAAMVGLCGWVLLFAGRTLSEGLAAPFLVIAVTMIDRPDATRASARAAIGAGILLGLAVVVRYGSIPIVIAVMLWMAVRRDWRALLALIAGGAIIASGLAALDWATWGRPLHSLLAYVDFNVYPGEGAKRLSTNPPWYYLKYFVAYLPLWAWAGLWMRARRSCWPVPLAIWAAAFYLAIVAITPHKEPRFLYPAVVLLMLAGASDLAMWLARLRRIPFALAATVVVAISLANYTLHSDLNEDEFHAIVRAARSPTASGLLILTPDDWGSAGYFFIGKNIPRITAWDAQSAPFAAAMEDARINRVVTPREYALRELSDAGFAQEQQIGARIIWSRQQMPTAQPLTPAVGKP